MNKILTVRTMKMLCDKYESNHEYLLNDFSVCNIESVRIYMKIALANKINM